MLGIIALAALVVVALLFASKRNKGSNNKSQTANVEAPSADEKTFVAQTITEAEPVSETGINLKQIAAITAAISCYLAGENYKIVSVRPVATSGLWIQVSRQEAVLNRQRILVGR